MCVSASKTAFLCCFFLLLSLLSFCCHFMAICVHEVYTQIYTILYNNLRPTSSENSYCHNFRLLIIRVWKIFHTPVMIYYYYHAYKNKHNAFLKTVDNSTPTFCIVALCFIFIHLTFLFKIIYVRLTSLQQKHYAKIGVEITFLKNYFFLKNNFYSESSSLLLFSWLASASNKCLLWVQSLSREKGNVLLFPFILEHSKEISPHTYFCIVFYCICITSKVTLFERHYILNNPKNTMQLCIK